MYMQSSLILDLYESTGRPIALTHVSTSGLALALLSGFTKRLKFYIKVFKTLHFLNPQMDLVYIWYDYRYWSKILSGTTLSLLVIYILFVIFSTKRELCHVKRATRAHMHGKSSDEHAHP